MKQGSETWLEWRISKSATCSEYANALGVGYESRRAYMERKLGIKPTPEPNWMMLRGTEMESWVVEVYEKVMEEEYGLKVKLFVDAGRDDEADDRFGGSVDRVVELCTGRRFVLECKTCYSKTPRTEIPHGHILQMLGLCHAYGLPYAHYACYQEGIGFFLARVDFDPSLWRDHIYPRLCQFAEWRAAGVLPPNMPAAEKVALIKTIFELSTVSSIEPARELQ